MGQNKFCDNACTYNITDFDISLYKWFIDNYYESHWTLGGLPSALNNTGLNTEIDVKKYVNQSKVMYSSGIPIGSKAYDYEQAVYKYYIYNHFTFNVKIHQEKRYGENNYAVVGFDIVPISIGTKQEDNKTTYNCHNESDYTLNFIRGKQHLDVPQTVFFTYDVVFELSEIHFSSRWDYYFIKSAKYNIQVLSFISSFLVGVILILIIFYIFFRSIKKDIELYNIQVLDGLDEQVFNDNGWKQISNDVFRKPERSMLFSAVIGSGLQLLLMFFFILMLATMGFLHPESRGAFLTLVIVSFVFLSVIAGYFSARFFKMFGSDRWLINALSTAVIFPSFAFSIFFLINLFLWYENSSAAVPFKTILTILTLWLCCASPLVLIGAIIGVKRSKIKNPCKINAVPSVPEVLPWYCRTKIIYMISGFIPFMYINDFYIRTIFVELRYIMSSMWSNHYHYMFGFLFISLIILTIISAQISIIFTFLIISRKEYRWWWKSFMFSGSSGIYIFLYGIYYYFYYLRMINLSSIILYFGYMFLFSVTFMIVTGTIGVVSTYVFLRQIYQMIKIN